MDIVHISFYFIFSFRDFIGKMPPNGLRYPLFAGAEPLRLFEIAGKLPPPTMSRVRAVLDRNVTMAYAILTRSHSGREAKRAVYFCQ